MIQSLAHKLAALLFLTVISLGVVGCSQDVSESTDQPQSKTTHRSTSNSATF